MKSITTILLILFIGFTTNAQYDCSKFYPFTEGAKSQLTLYNGKNKVQGMVEYEVLKLSTTGGSVSATMKNRLFDEKGSMLSESEYEALCSDGVVSIDFKSLMRPGLMDAYGNMETEVTGTNLDLPNDLEVGQSLPDAEINVKMSMSGMNMNMKTAIVDRKVIGRESITTPAGTFDCFVLTQTMEIKSIASNMSRTSKQWVAEGVGVVKTEDYNKKGKLDGVSLLTAFNK
ncbi:TapB family protein [Constantimarinum furrinae]|uniref:DUF3108 domain-containing protein n=1 Tax=Constantimarinum furrinae TaxID=2562285 RepID=A0A7G8PUF0_9FLAO|nr:hypothetical protein [Constantimarinum furrinae]QNJ97966.1 hypothetical protein ALE3EI_1404 [Constantimarinum furrinae]